MFAPVIEEADIVVALFDGFIVFSMNRSSSAR